MKKDLYLDCEWYMNQTVFLVGYVHSSADCSGKPSQLLNRGQLYDQTLHQNSLVNILQDSRYIFFYGPDIGMLEKCFGLELRNNYKCVNLLKIFRQAMPGLPSYKLGDLELMYGINRGTRKYKSNIFQALRDWNHPQKRKLVLKYNMEDTVNLFRVKEKIFASQHINNDFLEENLLQGIDTETHRYDERYTPDYSLDFAKWFVA